MINQVNEPSFLSETQVFLRYIGDPSDLSYLTSIPTAALARIPNHFAMAYFQSPLNVSLKVSHCVRYKAFIAAFAMSAIVRHLANPTQSIIMRALQLRSS